MLNLLWTGLKAFGRFIKIHFTEIILIVATLYIVGLFSDMKAEIKKIQSDQAATVAALHGDFGTGIRGNIFIPWINGRCRINMLTIPEYQSRFGCVMCAFNNFSP